MILGLDPGTRRIGVAVADNETGLARPLEVIDAAVVDPISRIAELVRELSIECIVVGRPVGLSGREGPAMEAQRRLIEELRAAISVPVDEFDERLTTVVAERGLRAAGGSGAQRKRVRDAVAAQIMLQGYLDSRR